MTEPTFLRAVNVGIVLLLAVLHASRACDTDYDDVGSLAYLAPWTVEATVYKEPSPDQTDATLRVNKVHFGSMTTKRITVTAEPFGPCSVPWKTGNKMILFLNAVQGSLINAYSIYAAPAVANKKNKKILKRLSCGDGGGKTCGKLHFSF